MVKGSNWQYLADHLTFFLVLAKYSKSMFVFSFLPSARDQKTFSIEKKKLLFSAIHNESREVWTGHSTECRSTDRSISRFSKPVSLSVVWLAVQSGCRNHFDSVSPSTFLLSSSPYTTYFLTTELSYRLKKGRLEDFSFRSIYKSTRRAKLGPLRSSFHARIKNVNIGQLVLIHEAVRLDRSPPLLGVLLWR